MSAVFEISIFSKLLIPIDILLSKVKKHDLSFRVDSIEIIDNWEYNTKTCLEPSFSMNLLNDYIKNKKIVMLSALLGGKYRCGYFSEIKENNFLSNIWISTKDIEYLDKDNISTDNKLVYETITNGIIEISKLYNIFLCGIGVESFIKYNKSIELIIKESKNINRWILSNREQLNNLYGFIKSQNSDFIILSRN